MSDDFNFEEGSQNGEKPAQPSNNENFFKKSKYKKNPFVVNGAKEEKSEPAVTSQAASPQLDEELAARKAAYASRQQQQEEDNKPTFPAYLRALGIIFFGLIQRLAGVLLILGLVFLLVYSLLHNEQIGQGLKGLVPKWSLPAFNSVWKAPKPTNKLNIDCQKEPNDPHCKMLDADLIVSEKLTDIHQLVTNGDTATAKEKLTSIKAYMNEHYKTPANFNPSKIQCDIDDKAAYLQLWLSEIESSIYKQEQKATLKPVETTAKPVIAAASMPIYHQTTLKKKHKAKYRTKKANIKKNNAPGSQPLVHGSPVPTRTVDAIVASIPSPQSNANDYYYVCQVGYELNAKDNLCYPRRCFANGCLI